MKDFTTAQYMIGLMMIEGVGHITAKRLVSYCGGPAEVFSEKANNLVLIPGVGEFIARTVAKSKDVLQKAEEEIHFCEDNNISIFTYIDPEYPYRLKNCEDGPLYIFADGHTDLNAGRMISIIGTRNCSPYGREFTEKLVEDFIPYDVTIVSGMAYGIDIAAHKACLKHDIPTVGVIANGIEKIYPPVHTNLARKIARQKGCILTEFLHGSDPDKENFPKRNRIVAGMCDATIVIETDLKGGSMITARLANDYNRDVFALPGRPGEEKSRGCNFLIKSNRAALFESVEDIVNLMGWQHQEKNKQAIQTSLFTDLAPDEKQIADLLRQKGKLMVDAISIATEQPVSKVSVTLLNLEFKGAVRSLPGKMYELV